MRWLHELTIVLFVGLVFWAGKVVDDAQLGGNRGFIWPGMRLTDHVSQSTSTSTAEASATPTVTPGPSPTATSPTPTPSATPSGPLPDLFVSEGLICQAPRGLFVHLRVKNGGATDAGAFRVARVSGEDFREPEWRVSQLSDGVEVQLEHQVVGSQVSRFYVDTDNEVAESDESNNLWMPTKPAVPPGVTATLPAPPTCIPPTIPPPGGKIWLPWSNQAP